MGLRQRLGVGFVHNLISGRDTADAHPLEAITGLTALRDSVNAFNFQPAEVADDTVIITGVDGQQTYYITITTVVNAGGGVQISVDGGLTHYALYDANGQPITSLQAGYTRVIYVEGQYRLIPETGGSGWTLDAVTENESFSNPSGTFILGVVTAI